MTQKKTTRTTTVAVRLSDVALSSEEERVLRLRRGLAAPGTEALELKPTQNDRAREKLLAIEREMVHKLRAEAQRRTDRKNKIVAHLSNKPKRG